MVRPSQPYALYSKQDGKALGGDFPNLDLRHYQSDAQAILSEDCNDAVHLLYPHTLARQADLFINGFAGDSLYAIKSNPHVAVLKILWARGIRKFEVASLREVEYARNLFPEAELFFMHPVKSRKAIRQAYGLGVRNFAFDGFEELRKIEEETGQADDLNLLLRVKVEQSDAAYPLDGKFGASLQEVPLLLQRAWKPAGKLGLTFHVGSQCMDPHAYRRVIEEIALMMKETDIAIDVLDIGGGFPVQYPGMEPPVLDDYFGIIREAVHQASMKDIHLLCEPGRAMVAEAGAVAVRVELRKGDSLYLNDGTYGALFDAGISSWPYPLEVIGADGLPKAGHQTHFKFFGPTCDSLDVMNGPFPLDETIQEGDWIIFRNLGAYGFAMQTRFNGFYSETTVSVDEGNR